LFTEGIPCSLKIFVHPISPVKKPKEELDSRALRVEAVRGEIAVEVPVSIHDHWWVCGELVPGAIAAET
jgi:hypothetical protein